MDIPEDVREQAAEIKRLRALVEQAFRDGFALATLIDITPDYAWQQSKVRPSREALGQVL